MWGKFQSTHPQRGGECNYTSSELLLITCYGFYNEWSVALPTTLFLAVGPLVHSIQTSRLINPRRTMFKAMNCLTFRRNCLS